MVKEEDKFITCIARIISEPKVKYDRYDFIFHFNIYRLHRIHIHYPLSCIFRTIALMEARSKLLVNRILKDIAKDIKEGNKEDPASTIEKINSLLDLANVVLAKYNSDTMVDSTVHKPKRKYCKRIKLEPGVEAAQLEATDQAGSVLA